jgi:RNA polymerase sporulation-specific sigma factor
MDDNQLCACAALGNDDAFAALLEKYISVIRKKAYEYSFCGIDVEDLTQEGTIGLINAVNSYDPASGVDFYPFACICIDRSIISVVRKSLRKKQIPADMMVPFDDQLSVAEADSPERMIIEKESYDRLMKSVKGKLTEFEFNVLNHYLYGESYHGIAKTLNCEPKAVDNAMVRIRRKLKRGRTP